MNKPREPKIMRDVRDVIGTALKGVDGVYSYLVGAQYGERVVVEIRLQPKQRAAVARYWDATMDGYKRKGGA